MFKLHVHNSRGKHLLNIMGLLTNIKQKKQKRQNTVYFPTVKKKKDIKINGT